MAKSKLVTKLADEIGTTTTRARRFIDDVGPGRAERLADEAAQADESAQFPWKPALAGVGVTGVGAGTLYWREQDVRKAKAAAEEAQSYEDSIKKIVESDLPPEMKQQLAESASQAAANNPSGAGNPVDGLTDFLGDLWPGNLDLGLGNIAVILLVLMIGYAVVQSRAEEGIGA